MVTLIALELCTEHHNIHRLIHSQWGLAWCTIGALLAPRASLGLKSDTLHLQGLWECIQPKWGPAYFLKDLRKLRKRNPKHHGV